jgi:hypothetical protein
LNPDLLILAALLYSSSLFGWLVDDGWCWFVLREEYCWLVAGGWWLISQANRAAMIADHQVGFHFIISLNKRVL